MKIVIGGDNHGFLLFPVITKHLEELGHEVINVGTFSNESCDYPIYAKDAAQKVSSKEADFGVLICSSGEGIMMAANKVKGVRCGLAYNDEVAALMRRHNNANIIAFGADFMKEEDILRRLNIFLSTPFDGGRHQRRIDMFE